MLTYSRKLEFVLYDVLFYSTNSMNANVPYEFKISEGSNSRVLAKNEVLTNDSEFTVKGGWH